MFCCRRPTGAWVCFLLGAAALVPCSARSETIELSVESGLSDRLVSVEVYNVSGTRYVSLRSLIEQSGGSFAVLPTRARVDLFGETAWVKAGESRVHALSPFDLSKPILQQGEYLLLSADDIVDFFQRAFRKTVRVIGGGTVAPSTVASVPTAVPPTTPPTEMARPVVPPPSPAPDPEPGALEGLAPTASAAPKAYRTLVIDPGHGGYDTGAQSAENVTEDDIALAIALQLKGRLAANGPIRALLTRETDGNLTGTQRTNAITSIRPDFVISIHVGTSLSPTTRGVATFYSPPMTISTGVLTSGARTTTMVGARTSDESRRFAQAIGLKLAEATNEPLRGVVEAPMGLLGDLSVPGVLIEVGCISNPQDEQALVDPVYQGRVADGIAEGILAFAEGEDLTLVSQTSEGADVVQEN